MAKGVSLLESVLFTWLRRFYRLQRRLQHHYSSSLHPLAVVCFLHKGAVGYDRVGSKSIVAPLGFGNFQFPAESLSPITFTPQQVVFSVYISALGVAKGVSEKNNTFVMEGIVF